MSPFEKSRFYRPKSETESALNGPVTDRRASFTRRFRLGLLHVSGQAPQHARDVPLAQPPPSSTPPPSCSCGRRRAASTARASSEGAARARLEREEGGLLHNPLGPWRRPRSPARRSARRRRRRGRRRRPRDDAGAHRREARGFEQMLRQNAAMERLWSACTLQARGRGGVCNVPTDVLPGDAGGRSRLMVVPAGPIPVIKIGGKRAREALQLRCYYAAAA